MACYEVATLEALTSAEDELLAIIHRTKRPMPAAFYLLGRVYMRLNRCDTVLPSVSSVPVVSGVTHGAEQRPVAGYGTGWAALSLKFSNEFWLNMLTAH